MFSLSLTSMLLMLVVHNAKGGILSFLYPQHCDDYNEYSLSGLKERQKIYDIFRGFYLIHDESSIEGGEININSWISFMQENFADEFQYENTIDYEYCCQDPATGQLAEATGKVVIPAFGKQQVMGLFTGFMQVAHDIRHVSGELTYEWLDCETVIVTETHLSTGYYPDFNAFLAQPPPQRRLVSGVPQFPVCGATGGPPSGAGGEVLRRRLIAELPQAAAKWFIGDDVVQFGFKKIDGAWKINMFKSRPRQYHYFDEANKQPVCPDFGIFN